jgi:hypothetical protein
MGAPSVVVEDGQDFGRTVMSAEGVGVMVENSAAWPASTRMVRSPSSSTTVPDRTVDQSLPGWTLKKLTIKTGKNAANIPRSPRSTAPSPTPTPD